MPKPTVPSDLPDYVTSDVQLAHIDTTEFLKNGSARLCTAIFGLMGAAEADGYIVDREDFTIKRPKTEEELAEALTSHQRSWEIDKKAYEDASEDPEGFLASRPYSKWQADRFAQREGLPPVEWPETDED